MTECGQSERDAKLLAQSNLELMMALTHCLEFLRDAAIFLTEIGATREMQPQRVARLIESIEAAMLKAQK